VSTRVVGVDVARCLALLGMMATHILPGVVDGKVPLVHQVAAGRASALFAVLAGLSLALMAGGRGPLRGRPWLGMLAGTAVRAGVIGFVGLLLGELDSGIAVILVYYAVLFVVAVPFMTLSTPALLGVTVGWICLSPLLSHWLRDGLATTSYEVPSFDSFDAPGELARDLLLTGYYPVLTWLSYVLVGLLLGRLDLRSGRTSVLLASVGAAAALVAWQLSDRLLARPDVRSELVRTFEGAGWQGDLATTLADGLFGVTPTGSPWWLAVRAPHSGTTLDLLMTIGSALLVLAVCLAAGRAAPRVLGVLFGAGAMTFSLYSLHVLLRSDGLWDGDDLATYLGQAALVLGIGAAFRWAGRRGPLEFLTGEVSTGARRAVDRSPT
jgi:Heparan-alpha-glucosaminide N-acetyltransferase, catalytic